MALNEIRERIDGIDTQLTALLAERMRIVAEVAASKKATGKAVRDTAREESILCRVGELAGEDAAPYVRALYRHLFELSRARQELLLARENPVEREIAEAAREPGTLSQAEDTPETRLELAESGKRIVRREGKTLYVADGLAVTPDAACAEALLDVDMDSLMNRLALGGARLVRFEALADGLCWLCVRWQGDATAKLLGELAGLSDRFTLLGIYEER